MTLFSLSYKNVMENKWRSFTLGIFILLTSLLLVVFNSFVLTVKNNMREALVNSLIGDIQVRSAKTSETDMFSMKKTWDQIETITANEAAAIEKTYRGQSGYLELTKRVRYNAILVSDTEKEPVMVIGIEPGLKAYQKSLNLLEGRYLDPARSNEVIITEAQAKLLKVKIGDTLGVMSQSKDEYTVDIALTVVGVGSVQMLSMFGFSPVYMDLKSAQELAGFNQGEVSDVILYTNDREQVENSVLELTKGLEKAGSSSANFKITTYKNMGGYIMGILDIFVMMFYSFVFILLFIVVILIINLVSMMGLERRQEIGTLRAIGFSKSRIVWIFMSEILLIAAFFCLTGVIIGTGIVLFLSQVGINVGEAMAYVIGRRFVMQFDIWQIIPAMAIIFGLTVAAALYPSFSAASAKPVETLKEIN